MGFWGSFIVIAAAVIFLGHGQYTATALCILALVIDEVFRAPRPEGK